MAIPSKPTSTSVIFLTPFFWHKSNSLFLILLEALVTSGVSNPWPLQNNFIPPPVPVASILGVGMPVLFPKVSATTVAKGNTVEDPTISILSLALTDNEYVDKVARAIEARIAFLKIIFFSIKYLSFRESI